MKKKLLLLILTLFVSSVLFAQYDKNNAARLESEPNWIHQVSAYPNPFVDHTKIMFHSSVEQHIYFEVKNILGKSIFRTDFTSKQGLNEIIFQRDNIEKGMYIYSLQTDNEIISKRLVVR